MYAERVSALVQRRPLLAGPPQPEPFPLEEPAALRVLATPAWRGRDQLAALLAMWCALSSESTSACLYLLADPAVDGAPEEIEARVLTAAAAAGVALEGCGDINVLIEPFQADRDRRLHSAVDVYVPLHPACAGHLRLATEAGHPSFEPNDRRLAELLAAAPAREPLTA